MSSKPEIDSAHPESGRACMTRRSFLLAGASTIVLSSLPGVAGAVHLAAREYPRRAIIALKDLKVDQPVDFVYPPDKPASSFFIVRLGEAAGGGVGPDRDIVAFSNLCSHMGGPLNGTYKAGHKAMGPCPLHLTTFDLTRHGMVISGHATESLPQARLEVVNGKIYATGVMGLIYGHDDNLA
ncbi:MAG TPA: arsenate reductase (azurin) small subunit [Gammaproteobacteria bacterium]|nr:arsenate reductase (azurin) small subunit [Gammaproteobacteria bacterium]